MQNPNDGFFGVYLHPNTIPQLRAGHYLLGIGRATGDPEDMLTMLSFKDMEGLGSGSCIVSGDTAEQVQAQARNFLRLYDELLSRGVSSKDALLKVQETIPQAPQAR